MEGILNVWVWIQNLVKAPLISLHSMLSSHTVIHWVGVPHKVFGMEYNEKQDNGVGVDI